MNNELQINIDKSVHYAAVELQCPEHMLTGSSLPESGEDVEFLTDFYERRAKARLRGDNRVSIIISGGHQIGKGASIAAALGSIGVACGKPIAEIERGFRELQQAMDRPIKTIYVSSDMFGSFDDEIMKQAHKQTYGSLTGKGYKGPVFHSKKGKPARF